MSSPGRILKVNPDALRSVGASFGQAADGLAGIQADAPLSDAAGAVSELMTADACRKAQSDVAAKITALAEGARTYGANLAAAADHYQTSDQGSAAAIAKIEFPK